VYTIREALNGLGVDIKNTSASIQGCGNVAQYAARLYQELGGNIVSISCWDHADQIAYSYTNDDGFDAGWLPEITDPYGSIDQSKALDLGCKVAPYDAWLKQDVDILIPAAMENQINLSNVDSISKKVKIIAEGANGPINTAADEIIRNSGIFVIPDFLCNAGGVTCSYFEQVQSNANYYWEKEEVLQKLDSKMTSAFRAVRDINERHKIYTRDAAYVIAINRVAHAVKMRGWV